MSQSQSHFKTIFKWVRILLLLVVLAYVGWYSYNLRYYSQINDYDYWSEGMAVSSKDGKYGYVNDTFRLAIDYQFDSAEPFYEGLAIVRKGSKYCLINKKGQAISDLYYEIAPLGEQKYKVRRDTGNKWQLLGSDGQIIDKTYYNAINPYKESRAKVCTAHEGCGFIDENGKMVIALGRASKKVFGFTDFLPIDNGYTDFSEGLATTIVVNGNKTLIGYMDKQGNTVIEPQFIEAKNFSQGLAVVKTEQGVGVINKQGQYVVVPNKDYQDITSFKEDRAIFSQGAYQGVFDRQGNILVSADQELHISEFSDFNKGFALISHDSKHGLIDKQGKIIIPPIYYELGSRFVNGVIMAIHADNPDEILYLDKNNILID